MVTIVVTCYLSTVYYQDEYMTAALIQRHSHLYTRDGRMYYQLACIPTASYSVVNDHATLGLRQHRLINLIILSFFYAILLFLPNLSHQTLLYCHSSDFFSSSHRLNFHQVIQYADGGAETR
jgi:hypothetical protein